jgi:diaminopimelate decarboxylase
MNNLELAEKYGTPLYVYDSQKIIRNFERFVNCFSVPKLRVHYAMKALSNISILKLIKSIGAGLDCVSIQEVQLGLHAGFTPDDIIFTPNSISEEEYEKALELGVKINIDNLQILEYFGFNHPDVPICIRINPHLMAGGNKNISVGHIDSKFGISIHQMPLAKRLIRNYNMNVEGIHVHTGSDILDAEIFIRASELIFAIAEEMADLKYLDFGSGFKVKYKKDGMETDIEKFGRMFSDKFNAFCSETGKELELRFEPGKYLVSESGVFLARVNVIKQTTSCTFLGLDTGFNHLIRPMFYDAYHEIENVSNPDGERKLYTVVGYYVRPIHLVSTGSSAKCEKMIH